MLQLDSVRLEKQLASLRHPVGRKVQRRQLSKAVKVINHSAIILIHPKQLAQFHGRAAVELECTGIGDLER